MFILRYGLEDGISRTLGETAKFFGITRERVRQIEVAAMRKLRAIIAAEEQSQAGPSLQHAREEKGGAKKKSVNGKISK